MPQTLEKLKGQIALGLYVRPPVRRSKFKDRVLKFHRWIPHQKITDLYIFKLDYLPVCSYATLKWS